MSDPNADLIKRRETLSPERQALLDRWLEGGDAPTEDRYAIPRVADRNALPLSFAQERLWFLDQLEAGTAYHMRSALRLRGQLDDDALRQSLEEIVRRHEVLRTSFPATVDGLPVQRIAESIDLPLRRLDLSTLAAPEREQEARRLVEDEVDRVFDVATGPLVRWLLIRLDPAEHLLVMTMHHIVSDGWSMGVLFRELSALYEAYRRGEPSPLNELPVQYADYAHWQRAWLQGAVWERDLAYWRQRLGDDPHSLDLPTDRPRPRAQTWRGGAVTTELSGASVETLRSLSQSEDATLFMVLVAAFKVLLMRYTAQKDILIGMPISARDQREVEDLIGCFLNTLVLRTDLSGEPTFRTLLQRVRRGALEAYSHQSIPFEKILEELQPKRDLSRTPYFQVFCNMADLSGSNLELPGLEIEPLGHDIETAKFDLTLYLLLRDDRLAIRLNYNADLFDHDTVEMMVSNYRTLLGAFVSDPDRPVTTIRMQTQRDAELLPDPTVVLTETDQESVPALVDAWAARSPEQLAIARGARSWSYGDLAERAAAIAGDLRLRGMQRGEVVAIRGAASFGAIAAMLGAMRSGGVLLTLDPSLPVARQQVMLREAGVTHLIELGPMVPGDRDLPRPAHVIGVDSETGRPLAPPATRANGAANGPEPVAGPGPNDPAYVFFTSGSTGVPKGVLGVHKALSHFLTWQRNTFAVGPGDRCAQVTALSFDVVLRDILLPLVSGATLCLPEERDRMPDRLLAWLARDRITLVHTVPALADAWLAECAPDTRLPDLRCTFFAGEPLTEALVRRWRERLSRDARIVNLYGPTETTLAKCWYAVPGTPVPGVQPIGHALPQTQAIVLNTAGEQCGIGEPGEIVLRTPYRSRGYINASAEDARRFIPNPFRNDENDLLYRTGDRGRYAADGTLRILGRLDHQVKIHGVRVEPDEVAATLAGHPAVGACVVTAPSDPEGVRRLVGYVVPAAEALDREQLSAFLRERLPIALVPSCFVLLDDLPRNPNGKVDRRALPAPDWERRERTTAFVAPRDGTEEVLCAIWGNLLGVDRVGVHDNFFELGGHSLLATQLTARIRRTLEIEVPLRDLFDYPTVAELATRIQSIGARPETPPLVRCARDGDLPLSFAQQRLWFLDQMDVGAAYNMPRALRLRGRLDVERLEQVLEEVVRRHEALRTSFPVVNEQPVQRIAEALEFELNRIDVCELGAEAQEAEVLRLAQEEAERPFELATGPLLRGTLLRLGDEEHVLLLTMHHIVSDGWSMGVLFRELTTLYEAFSQGEASPLVELEIQYGDFAQWQRSWLEGEALDEQLSYWRGQLADVPTLDLPTDRRRPAEQAFDGASHGFEIPSELGEALQQLSRQEGLTLAMVLLAGWQVLLSRYSGQDDVAVGSPIANRTHDALEPLIGFFVNMLVMRTDLSGDPSVEEVLRRVQEVSLSAYEHQDVPFEQVVHELNPPRDLSRHPLFQVSFAMQNAPRQALRLGDLEVDLLRQTTRTRFDLELHVFEHGGQVVGRLVYNTDLFEASTVQRIADHLVRLLEEMASDPSRRLSELSLLSDEARHQLLVEWNDTAAAYPDEKCIHELFEEQVERTPDAVAVVFGDQSLTYEQLNEWANQVAHTLRDMGVGVEDLVGLCVERSLEMVVGLLGILKAGGAYVPLDPAYPQKRLAFMLEDSGISVLLTQASLLQSLPDHRLDVLCLDRDASAIGRARSTNPPRLATAGNLAYVIYTSGSTGRPKGVEVQHETVARLFAATEAWYGFNAEDVWTLFHSYAFDFSVWEIWGALLYGGRLVVVPYGTSRSPEEFHALVCREGVTVLNQTPSAFRQFIGSEAAAQGRDDLALRFVIFGGEALGLESLRPWFERRGDQRPQLVNMYGITETTVHVTYRPIGLSDLTEAPGSVIGRPIPGLQVFVLDAHGQPCPIGVPGEMYVGGAGVTRGYLNRPELAAERFVPDPFDGAPGARLYRTGDLARYRSDGNLEFLGRLDDQVKLRGFRIELGEIESVLQQHVAVDHAVAVAREDRPGDRRLVAYVVPTKGASPGSSEVRGFLKERLPDYMVPSALVVLETLPLTPSGKVDRRALPAPDLRDQAGAFAAPRNGTEEVLCAIWGNVLGVDRVGVHDNFFELGGDSILSIQIVSRVNRAGIELTPRMMFQHQTVSELAAVAGVTTRPEVEQGLVTGSAPLLPIQQWLFEQELDDRHHFNQAMLLTLSEKVSEEALREVVEALLAHHDALRSRYQRSASGWSQSIAEPNDDVPLQVIDLTEAPATERSELIERHAAEVQASFDLSTGPLFKVVRYVCGESEADRLLLVAHHLVIDGVSWRVLFEDLEEGLRQPRDGRSVALPPKTNSVRRWAARLIEYANSPDLKASVRYWPDLPWSEVGVLPVDDADGANTVGSSDSVNVSLSPEETRALLQDVPAAYNTQINDVLLTALGQSLSVWTGTPSVLIDLEGHGREQVFEDVDLSRTVGWFTSLFPLVLTVGDGSDLGQTLKSIKEQLRQVPHRGVDYGVGRYLSDDEALRSVLSSLPGAEVSFNYLGQFTQVGSGGSLFGRAPESAGPSSGERNIRAHLLAVNGIVSGDQLCVRWGYSREVHRRETIAGVANQFVASLRALIGHCRAVEERGYTPSDFPEVGLDQRALDDLVASVRLTAAPKARERSEDGNS